MIDDLILYLDSFGFLLRSEDLEAILRRCDHDADQRFNFDEFSEIFEMTIHPSNRSQSATFEKGQFLRPSHEPIQVFDITRKSA